MPEYESEPHASNRARDERLRICERRKAHAEANVSFWMREICHENDEMARIHLSCAKRQLGDIAAHIEELRGATFVRPTNIQYAQSLQP